jgi:hypothetical protein
MAELNPDEAAALADLAGALGYVPEVVDVTAVQVFEDGPPAGAWLEVTAADRHPEGGLS